MDFDISDKAMEQLQKEFSGKTVRIFPQKKTWSGIIFDIAQDEPKEDDNIYQIGSVKVLIKSKIESYAPFINIDYESYKWGDDYVITTHF